jgi:hypothetical protein
MTQVYTCYRNTVFILTLLTPSLHNIFRPPGPSSSESQTLSFLYFKKTSHSTDPLYIRVYITDINIFAVITIYSTDSLSWYVSRQMPLSCEYIVITSNIFLRVYTRKPPEDGHRSGPKHVVRSAQ